MLNPYQIYLQISLSSYLQIDTRHMFLDTLLILGNILINGQKLKIHGRKLMQHVEL